ncbi:hypothetical protein HDV63DRAFT_361460 [Trichoderma sp. SZMC 28014]
MMGSQDDPSPSLICPTNYYYLRSRLLGNGWVGKPASIPSYILLYFLLLSVHSTPPLTVDSAEKYCYIYTHIYVYKYVHVILCFYIRDEASHNSFKLPDGTLHLHHSTKEAFSLVRRKSITPRQAVGASSCPCQSCSFAPLTNMPFQACKESTEGSRSPSVARICSCWDIPRRRDLPWSWSSL